MRLERFKDKLFKMAKEYGFENTELFMNESSSFDLRVFKQEVDHYSINEDERLSFRGIYEGKMGYKKKHLQY